VDEVILSCGFMSDDVKRVLGDIYDGMRLRYVVEDEPLGTAGPCGWPTTRGCSRSACSS
jgi:NDP-sugar pyrophosphorylase family protein